MDTPFLKPASDSLLKAANDRAADATTTELLIVEGKSAANALDQVRDRRRQGIFMMQGKIPNPETARLTRLQRHEQCAALMRLLKDDTANTTGYDHVVIVPDADVDGRHSAILLITLFRNYLSNWMSARRLHLFRTPLARIGDNPPATTDKAALKAAQPCYLNTADEVQQWLASRTANSPPLTHFKGLAAINPLELAILLDYPVHSNTRSICLAAATAKQI